MSVVSRGGKRQGLEIRKLVYLAILTAIVFVLQFVSMGMRTIFALTFVLMPLVIGSAVCGKWSGAWLGFVFGVAVLATGDAAAFLAVDPLGTVVTVLMKGILAGLGAGLVYGALERVNRYLAIFVAAVVAPIVNSGVFVLGCYLFFIDALSEWVKESTYANVHHLILFGYVGINFLIELGTNCLLSPAALRIIDVQKPRRQRSAPSDPKLPGSES